MKSNLIFKQKFMMQDTGDRPVGIFLKEVEIEIKSNFEIEDEKDWGTEYGIIPALHQLGKEMDMIGAMTICKADVDGKNSCRVVSEVQGKLIIDKREW